MKQSKLELTVGIFVLAGLLAVAYLAIKIGAGTVVGADTYSVKARFNNTGGINPGSNVLIAGVPVGRVGAITLNPTDFSAIVELKINSSIKLPDDTIASIKTSGLIGDKYIALSPGGDTENLAPGTTITNTESSIDIESIISRFAFGSVTPKSGK